MTMGKFNLKPLVAAIAMLTTGIASAQSEQVLTEEVVVKGYRESLEKSLNLKRESVNARESIVAEDIGKMPDLNLAEAIQRVPGVTIIRQGGEGRQISLRGLGAAFTHVTMNGMEVPAATGGLDSGGGINDGRAFDFNVFSAELFNRIDINKAAKASIEEGGIAGSVELYTLRPLDNPERTIVASGQMGYNDLSKENDPRLTFIYSDANEAESVGWMFSIASTERNVHQDGFGTVRWDSPTRDNSEFAANNTGLSDEVVNAAYYPRLPRQDSFHHTQDRVGISTALQFRPMDDLEFGINYVHSTFEADVRSYNSFAQFRRSGQWGWPHNTVESVTIEDDNGVPYAVAGSFTGVGLRTESRLQEDESEFNQLTADLDWNLSDNLLLSAMIGSASADYEGVLFRANIETLRDDPDTAAANDGGAGFSYDFTRDANVAAINYDIDLTDSNEYYIVNDELLRVTTVERANDTARLDLSWSISDESTLKFGTIMNEREIDSAQNNGTSEDPTDIAALTTTYTYADIGGYGSNTDLEFLVFDFDLAIPAYGPEPYTISRGPGSGTWNVLEETTGFYVDYDLDSELAGHGIRANFGVRYVETDVTSTGWLNQNDENIETNSFDNTLPSLNIAFDATEEMVLRFGAAKTVTRPTLSSLVPSKGYSNVNFSVSGGNSQLEPLESTDLNLSWEWYFAEEAMLAFGFFQKDIDSFITSPTSQEPLRPEDYGPVATVYPTQPELLDPSLIWTYRSAANTDGTEMDGWEIAYQQAFSALPGFLSNFGVTANYSHVEGKNRVSINGVEQDVDLLGLSENSYNATLYYEVDDWGARISVNNRDDYVTGTSGGNNNLTENTTGPTHVDLSAFYNFNDSVTLTFELINATEEFERLYTTGSNGNANLPREYNTTGRQFFLGIRASF